MGERLPLSVASPFVRERTVLFQEIDAAGLVFFPRILDWCHDAFFELLVACGVSMPDVLASREWGSPLVHVEADYALPLRFGDAVRVCVVGLELGGSSMTVRYRVQKMAENKANAVTLVHAFIDPKTGKPRPVPSSFREAVKGLATDAARA